MRFTMFSPVVVVLIMALPLGGCAQNWEPPVAIPGAGWFSAMQAVGNTVHSIWTQGGTIQYRRSTDEATTWTSPTTIATADSIEGTGPLHATGTNLSLLFVRGGNLFYKGSSDGGATWGSDFQIVAGVAGTFFRAGVERSGSSIHVVWVHHTPNGGPTTGVFYRRSSNGGASWEATRLIVPPISPGYPGRPQLTVSGNTVHVGFTDSRDGQPGGPLPEAPSVFLNPQFEVYYKRSLDGGTTWESDTRMSFEPPYSGRPDILDIGNNVILYTWDEFKDGDLELYLRRSTDNGATWGPYQRLTFTNGITTHSTIAHLGSTTHIAFNDRQTGIDQVYYKQSLDGGITWTADERVTFTSTTAYAGGILATANYAIVSYVLTHGAGGAQIYYRRKTLAGPSNTPPTVAVPASARER